MFISLFTFLKLLVSSLAYAKGDQSLFIIMNLLF